MKRTIVLTLVLLGACTEETIHEGDTILPTDPGGSVTVSAATNCAPTGIPGEIEITDTSQPAAKVDNVAGRLFDPSGASKCTWSISRVGNLSGSFTCRGLIVTGAYSFNGNVILNTGQDPTPVTGGCTLSLAAVSS